MATVGYGVGGARGADLVGGTLRSELEALRRIAPASSSLHADVFYKDHASSLPRLKTLAEALMSVSPSTIVLESAWSTAGNIIDQNRTKLSDRNFDMLLFLNLNDRFMPK